MFKADRKNLIKELKRVNFDLDQIDRNKYHLRGLEPYLSIKYNKYMQKKRSAVLQTVMTEQTFQIKDGLWDPESLRVACCEASAWARERATDLGCRDAKAVGYDVFASSTDDARPRHSSWGDESDHSAAPSMCSTVASASSASFGSSTRSFGSSTRSFGSDSLDSLELQSPRAPKLKSVLESVDELPSTLQLH